MNIIYLALASDDNYANYASITLRTIVNHAVADRYLHVTIFDGGISESKKKLIQEVIPSSVGCVVFYLASDAGGIFDGLPTAEHWTTAMYYRLLVGEALPSEATRVIYLDCDLFVEESLHTLFDLDMEGKGLAAVENPSFTRGGDLGLPSTHIYFNSGVLLIDLIYWRTKNLINKAISIAEDKGEGLVSPDQDLLNLLYCNQVKLLEPKWNKQVSMYKLPRFWQVLRRKGGITHFTTNVKPWRYGDPNPKADQFRNVAKEMGISLELKFSFKESIAKTKRFIMVYLPFIVWSLFRNGK